MRTKVNIASPKLCSKITLQEDNNTSRRMFSLLLNMERLYCLLVTAFLLLSQLLVISCAFIIILDVVDIMLCIHTILSQANALVACALNIMLDAVDILLCMHAVIS